MVSASSSNATAALGVGIDHRFEQYVFLTPTAEGGPSLAFQRVPESKVGKNRLHLDLVVDYLAAAVAELSLQVMQLRTDSASAVCDMPPALSPWHRRAR